MKPGKDRWETAGSLTPELEGTPRSGIHPKRGSPSQSQTVRIPKKPKAERTEHPGR